MHSTLLFIIFFTFFNQIAFSGNESGHGGIVITCGQSGGTQTLDYFEAKASGQLFEAASGSNEFEVLEVILKNIERLDKQRADLYRLRIKDFFNESFFVTDQALSPTEDLGGVEIPDGCKLLQAVIQFTPVLSGGIRYHIHQQLWKKMDVYNRAFMILHEVAYSEAIALGHPTSRLTREFVAFLFSQSLKMVTHDLYKDTEKHVRFDGVAQAPFWLRDPIEIFSCEKEPVEFDLKPLVVDPKGKKITLLTSREGTENKILPWLSLKNGVLKGIPQQYDAPGKFEIKAWNGTFDSYVKVKVLFSRCADVIKPVTRTAILGKLFFLDLRSKIPKSYRIIRVVQAPIWIQVSDQFELMGTPPTIGKEKVIIELQKEMKNLNFELLIDVVKPNPLK